MVSHSIALGFPHLHEFDTSITYVDKVYQVMALNMFVSVIFPVLSSAW